MNRDGFEAYVVERLSAGIAPDDVIFEVTQRSGPAWPEAEELVRHTADLGGPSVARRQFPLLALVATAVMLGGLGVLAAGALSFSDVLLLLKPACGVADQDGLAALLAVVAANGPMLGLIPLGVGMLMGGILGLVRALQATEPMDWYTLFCESPRFPTALPSERSGDRRVPRGRAQLRHCLQLLGRHRTAAVNRDGPAVDRHLPPC